MSKRNPTAIAVVIAVLVTGVAAGYRLFDISESSSHDRPIPDVGRAGSTHVHASLLIMVNNRMIDFCKPTYMLRSDIVHFEDDDCHTVHKHATGVTMATFLETIDVSIANDCLSIEGVSYCREGLRRVRVVYNGVEIAPEELRYREIRNNDHVLINYGADDDLGLRFKYNQVPNIPHDINKPR